MVAKLSDHFKDGELGDFSEGSLKRLLGAILAKYGLEVLRMSQDRELVDATARLTFLLWVKSHLFVLPNPGLRWKQDVSATLMKFDRANPHQCWRFCNLETRTRWG